VSLYLTMRSNTIVKSTCCHVLQSTGAESKKRSEASEASNLSLKPHVLYTYNANTVAVTDLSAAVAVLTRPVKTNSKPSSNRCQALEIRTVVTVPFRTVESLNIVKSVIVPAFPTNTSNCCRVLKILIRKAITVAVTDLPAKSKLHTIDSNCCRVL